MKFDLEQQRPREQVDSCVQELAALERDGVQRPLGERELSSGRLGRADPLFEIQPFARIAPAGQ